MTTLNKVGARLGPIAGVTALTDVTGFGLLGHLIGMCEGSRVRARVDSSAVPLLPGLDPYLAERCWPGGTERNWDSYGAHVGEIDERARVLLCDPQTSGGLLVAVRPSAEDEFLAACSAEGVAPVKVGEIIAPAPGPLVLIE
jgi:selenide,water dikinase